MRFPILTTERAREFLDICDAAPDEVPESKKLESTAGAGEQMSLDDLNVLVDELKKIHQQHKEDPKTFDALAAVLIHQQLPEEPELLGSDGFWRWLAVTKMREIVLWRFPPSASDDTEQSAAKYNRRNFGVGASARQRAECYPYKLWLRAELGVARDGDAYRYVKRGDVDFWTSHIHRQSYTTNRKLCAALIKFQYPDELAGSPHLISGTENREKGQLGIRTLAKKLRRLQASHELSILDEDELLELIQFQAEGLTKAA